ncbi:MAG TPA: tyrosine-protein phosphatase, partial [Herpetosiphonaceae bacterium]|nr:tyrosine-protein phosphatase [Herpetosiphonaceae bacterium]
FLERKPDRCAAAVTAVARAAPGGVVVHCGVGRDRTGLISLLLLALVGVGPDDIVSDYKLSTERLQPLWTERGEEDQGLQIKELLARKNTSARALLLDILGSLDIHAYLSSAGLREDDLDALRARLVG